MLLSADGTTGTTSGSSTVGGRPGRVLPVRVGLSMHR
jgi:hypothetical protein